MKFPRRILSWGLALVAWCCVFGASQTGLARPEQEGDREQPTVNEIVEIWRTRQNSIRTFDFNWQSDCFTLSIVLLGPEALRSTVPESFTFQARERLVLDRSNRGRVEYSGWSWSPSEKKLVESSTHLVFDGQKQTSFFPHGAVPFPDAHIGGDRIAEVVCNQRMVPLRLVFRAFDPVLGLFQPGQLELSSDQAILAGEKMVVLKQGGLNGQVVWLDPTKNYVPVRYFELKDGAVKWDFYISYIQDAEKGWVPSAWKLSWLGSDGSVVQSDSAVVTAYQLNHPVTDEVFKVELPVGTYLHNGPDETYIVEAGGVWRPVAPGQFPGTEPRVRNRWLILGGCLAITIALIFARLWYRRRQEIIS